MSMHEIEDLVEFSIRILHDRHPDGAARVRGAVAPRPLPLSEVVLDVVTAAQEQGDTEPIALWHALGECELREEAATEEPERIRVVRAIREIAVRTGAVSHELPDGVRSEPCGEWESRWAGEEGYEDIPIPL